VEINANREKIESLKRFIKFPDPTFQGLLPGATEEGLWNLVQKMADSDTVNNVPQSIPTVKRAASIALSLDLIFNLLSN